jgi:SAM-dependent methyltransferase
MKHEASWRASKYDYRNGRLTVGPEASEASWMITRLVADAYQRHLPAHARGRLIDLGCGTVPLYAAYRPLVAEVTCLDLHAGGEGGRHLDLEGDLNEPLPLASGAFDTVILSDVLEHVRRPEHLMGEIARILAPAGKLLLNVPFYYWLHAQPHDYFRYSEHALRSFVDEAGLRLLVLEVLGSAPEVIADIVGKHLGQLPKLGPLVSQALQWAVYTGMRVPKVSRALAPSSQRFPMAYFLVAEKG